MSQTLASHGSGDTALLFVDVSGERRDLRQSGRCPGGRPDLRLPGSLGGDHRGRRRRGGQVPGRRHDLRLRRGGRRLPGGHRDEDQRARRPLDHPWRHRLGSRDRPAGRCSGPDGEHRRPPGELCRRGRVHHERQALSRALRRPEAGDPAFGGGFAQGLGNAPLEVHQITAGDAEITQIATDRDRRDPRPAGASPDPQGPHAGADHGQPGPAHRPLGGQSPGDRSTADIANPRRHRAQGRALPLDRPQHQRHLADPRGSARTAS